MLKDIRVQLIGLLYSHNKASNITHEMESFFDALRLVDDLSIKEFSTVLSNIKLPQQEKDAVTTSEEKSHNNNLVDILLTNGISSSNYEDIKIGQIEFLEQKELLTKAMAIELANSIGISKKSYKTRKEVYEDIYRMIGNRDTMNATKNTLSNDSANKV